jgi:hypothetical protein
MDLKEFQATLKNNTPPAGLSPALQAMWQDGQGDWDRAHQILQSDNSRDGSWAHAYLHRKEGDLSNARYWYSRAGRPMPETSLEAEWADIVTELLAR